LVQISAEPFGPSIDKIRKLLSFIGEPKIKQKDRNTTLIFDFESEIQPVQVLKLKVETNCREHFSVFNLKKRYLKSIHHGSMENVISQHMRSKNYWGQS
jgi:hypothetical protein